MSHLLTASKHQSTIFSFRKVSPIDVFFVFSINLSHLVNEKGSKYCKDDDNWNEDDEDFYVWFCESKDAIPDSGFAWDFLLAVAVISWVSDSSFPLLSITCWGRSWNSIIVKHTKNQSACCRSWSKWDNGMVSRGTEGSCEMKSELSESQSCTK